MRLGVLANAYRPGFEEAIAQLDLWCRQGDHAVVFEASLADYLGPDLATGEPEDIVRASDVVLAFGGDGTMLRAARIVGPLELPILGVNLGSLGFLTQVTPDDLGAVLPQLESGDFHTEPRSVLAVSVDGVEGLHHAVNEVAVDRGPQSRAIEIRLDADDRLVCRYVADGLIVATPTGSTAYALSAGGPVTVPDLAALIVAPVAPHTLAQRPVVFPDRVVLRITCEEPNVEAALMLDGRKTGALAYGQSCLVRRADFELKLVRLPGQDFFNLVRTKLQWGVDPRHAHRDGRVV